MTPIIIGAVAGAFIGWLIAASKSKARLFRRGYAEASGMGCGSQLLLMLALAAVGAVIGAIVGAL